MFSELSRAVLRRPVSFFEQFVRGDLGDSFGLLSHARGKALANQFHRSPLVSFVGQEIAHSRRLSVGIKPHLLPVNGQRAHTTAADFAASTFASIQFHHQPVLERDAPVHARRDVHVVGGDDDRLTRGLHQLGERGEDVL